MVHNNIPTARKGYSHSISMIIPTIKLTLAMRIHASKLKTPKTVPPGETAHTVSWIQATINGSQGRMADGA